MTVIHAVDIVADEVAPSFAHPVAMFASAGKALIQAADESKGTRSSSRLMVSVPYAKHRSHVPSEVAPSTDVDALPGHP